MYRIYNTRLALLRELKELSQNKGQKKNYLVKTNIDRKYRI